MIKVAKVKNNLRQKVVNQKVKRMIRINLKMLKLIKKAKSHQNQRVIRKVNKKKKLKI